MTSRDADAAIMLRVRQGDTEAFRELVERHQRAVINTIYRAVGDSWEAEDLAQRVFIQAFRSANRYQESARFTTWLFTIVHHVIRNEYRRRSRHREQSIDPLDPPRESARLTANPVHVSTPAEAAMAHELEQRLQRVISHLPANQRSAFVLARFEGWPYEEIAQVIGCSLPATKSLIHRARVTLKEALRGYY